MAAVVDRHGVSRLDEAAEHLHDLAMARPIDDPTRPQLEAARDRLASYALAVHSVAEAGVSAERLAALIERGWRDAALAFTEAGRAGIRG